MKLDKYLTKLGIIDIEKIDNGTIREISKNVIELLVIQYPFLEDEYNNILAQLLTCNMYSARMTTYISKVNYIYENQSIYIDKSIDLIKPNGLILNECIHYIQDNRTETNKLKTFGICVFDEFKISGLGLNEAMLKYIVFKVFKEENLIEENLFASLARDILELLGEEKIIKGLLIPKNNLQDYFLNTFENNTNKIMKNFDMMLELYNNSNNEEKIKEDLEEIYKETKKLVYTTYFDKEIDKISEKYELEIYLKNMDKYEKSLEKTNDQEEINNFIKSVTYKIREAHIRINKAEKQRSLMVITKNKFQKILYKLKQVFNMA